MLKKFKMLLNEIKSINKKPVMNILPGQLAFFLTLSIPPLISLVGIIGSALSISTEGFISFIKTSFPASTSNLIIPIITDKGPTFGTIAFIIGALTLVSNGTNAIIIASNALYNVDDNNTIKRRIKALFLVIMLINLIAFIIVVPVFGDLIMSILKNVEPLSSFFGELMILYEILKYPVSFVFIYFIVKIIYTIAPDKDVKSRDVTHGAVFTTVIWIIATKVYSYYIANFSTYSLFYGSISNLIILLLFVYLLSYIFVLGMALNAGNHSLALNEKK